VSIRFPGGQPAMQECKSSDAMRQAYAWEGGRQIKTWLCDLALKYPHRPGQRSCVCCCHGTAGYCCAASTVCQVCTSSNNGLQGYRHHLPTSQSHW
jgi:hypothetical protein